MSERPSPATLVLEFTVEPFVEGRPGPHVTAAFAAAEASTADGTVVDIGPFGTTVSGPADTVIAASDRVVHAAFENGATRVSLQITAATV